MEGRQFAAELSQLRIVGRIDLPALGWTYASLNNAVAATAGREAAAFQAPGGGAAPSMAAWTELRDRLQNILGQTGANLQDAGVVIEHIVDEYAETDTAARDSLAAAWKPGTIPPGLVGSEEKLSYRNPPPTLLTGEE